MALFGFGKDKKDSGVAELVMAYLEDAQRVRTPFLLKDKRKVEVQATLQSLDEDAGTASFQAIGGTFEKGGRADLLFIQENLRMGASSRVVEARPNLVVLEIPDELELLERRKLARARLNPKEGATLTALTNLFEGVGVNGVIENISEGGCRIRVEKAMNIKDEKRLPLGTALLPKGQPFMLLKLNKVPKCPSVMELAGKVAYLEDVPGGLVMGVEFDKPRGDFASAIRGLVSSRTGAIPTSIPSKIRRKAQPQEEAPVVETPRPRTASEPPAATREAVPPPKAPEPASTPPPTGSASSEEAGGSVSDAQTSPRNPALVRLKKRTRAVLVMASPAYGQLLRDFLNEDGYGRVLLASTPAELAEGIRQPNVGMVFIDAEMPILECFEMVSMLHESDHDIPPVVVAAHEVSRALVLAAHRVGVTQLVVKPYSLDESFLDLLEQQMGL